MSMDQQQPEPTWEFVKRAERHHCAMPSKYFAGMCKIGDIIRCKECRKEYVLVSFDYGTQRDPINPPTMNWNLTSGHQEKP